MPPLKLMFQKFALKHYWIDGELNVGQIKEVKIEDMRRMFEPYFSKRPGGSGLGLTIVKKIVEDHNGYVRLRKNQPKGLIAEIELPYSRT